MLTDLNCERCHTASRRAGWTMCDRCLKITDAEESQAARVRTPAPPRAQATAAVAARTRAGDDNRTLILALGVIAFPIVAGYCHFWLDASARTTALALLALVLVVVCLALSGVMRMVIAGIVGLSLLGLTALVLYGLGRAAVDHVNNDPNCQTTAHEGETWQVCDTPN